MGTTAVALVLLDPGTCPNCGRPLERTEWVEAALFRYAGYGEAMSTVMMSCSCCRWSRTESTAVSPKKYRP